MAAHRLLNPADLIAQLIKPGIQLTAGGTVLDRVERSSPVFFSSYSSRPSPSHGIGQFLFHLGGVHLQPGSLQKIRGLFPRGFGGAFLALFTTSSKVAIVITPSDHWSKGVWAFSHTDGFLRKINISFFILCPISLKGPTANVPAPETLKWLDLG